MAEEQPVAAEGANSYKRKKETESVLQCKGERQRERDHALRLSLARARDGAERACFKGCVCPSTAVRAERMTLQPALPLSRIPGRRSNPLATAHVPRPPLSLCPVRFLSARETPYSLASPATHNTSHLTRDSNISSLASQHRDTAGLQQEGRREDRPAEEREE